METSPRKSAIEILSVWLSGERYADRLLEGREDRINHPKTLELLYGVIRNLSGLELIIDKYCAKKPSKNSKAALLIGIWQLLYTKTPPYAATNDTVQSAKRLKGVSHGFINGVLRTVSRNKECCLQAIEKSPIHIRTSHKKEFVDHLFSVFGEEATVKILEANNSVPQSFAIPLPFTNSSLAERIIKEWKMAGINTTITTNGAIAIPHGTQISALPGYDKGLFIIQDPATLTSIKLLGPKPGETILDCCAAPGGKTLQIASSLNDSGMVIASDKSEQRLQTLISNSKRTNLEEIIKTAVLDASSPEYIKSVNALLNGKKISAVLADVPCSNTGVFRRRLDAKWRWSASETKRLQSEQLQILRNISKLNPERIVYSTCSIDPVEDEDVVRLFLGENPDYTLSKEIKNIPDLNNDGSYAALIVRI